MKYNVLKDPDSDLTELLAREFELDFLKARNTAREISFDSFAGNYGILESLVGRVLAQEIVKNGNFLEYRNGSIDEYFQLLRTAAAKTDLQKLFDISAFYSIDSLNNFLVSSTPIRKKGSLDLSKLNITKTKLFHLADEQSRMYLVSLIEKGYLIVSTDEHWCKSRTGEKGPRSLDIIRKIAFQLRVSFSDLCLEKPEIEINYGTRTLKIANKTQENLKKIREELLKRK